MATISTYTKEELRKVVISKGRSGGGGGSGGGGTTPDVEVVTPKGKDGQENNEPKPPKSGKEGQEGQDGQGKDGTPGQDGQGKNGKNGESKPYDNTQAKTKEQIEKEAQDLIDALNNNATPNKSCGSTNKRDEAQKGQDQTIDDIINQKEARDRLLEAIKNAEDKGQYSPVTSSGRGTGTKGQESTGGADVVVVPRKRVPRWFKEIKDFASREYEREYYKSGVDWLYTQTFESIVFKDKPKVAVPQKFIYVLVDVSGSMTWSVKTDGTSLLENLLSFLPLLAEQYKGEVWFFSDGIVEFKDGTLGILKLEDYKDADALKQAELYQKIKSARGFGGGTTFDTELQAMQYDREGNTEKQKSLYNKASGKSAKSGKKKKYGDKAHQASIIIFSDADFGRVNIEYKDQEGKYIRNGMPPSTILVTDARGKRSFQSNYAADLKDKEKRVSVIDFMQGDEDLYNDYESRA